MPRDPWSRCYHEPSPEPPLSEAVLFAQAILEESAVRVRFPGSAVDRRRELLEWAAGVSTDRERELRRLAESEQHSSPRRQQLEWLAGISVEHERELKNLVLEEAAAGEVRERARRCIESLERAAEEWDEAKHPRLGGPPNAGWFASTGGSTASASSSAGTASKPDRFVLPRGPQYLAQVLSPVGATGAASSAWPTLGAPGSAVPKLGGAMAAGAKGAAVGAAGTLAGAARNLAMGAYWSNVPGVQAMPQEWVYDLEKRVRAGKLSREDALGIFQTAMLGAEAQGFRPTGNTRGAVWQSMMDFLAKAEAVYFARKKPKETDASKPGAYQNSGGKVFPTEKNSGLKGNALRKEQEEFFERGLAEGKTAEVLRGQAREAGAGRTARMGQPDQLDDAELEQALQRAIQKAGNR